MKNFEYEMTVENDIDFTDFKNRSPIVWVKPLAASYWIRMFTRDFTQERVSFHSKIRIHEFEGIISVQMAHPRDGSPS